MVDFMKNFTKQCLDGRRKKLNSWGSMFAIQALFWAENPEKLILKNLFGVYTNFFQMF